MKTLLLLGGAMEHCLAIRAAHKRGHCVVCVDGNPYNPGMQLADRAIVHDVYCKSDSLARLVTKVGKNKIDGVFTVAADVPYNVAWLAHHYGCRHIPMRAAEIVEDKYAMKEALRGEVMLPGYDRVPGKWEHTIVKPIHGRGARGVGFATSDMVAEARTYGEVMFEEYLTGVQLSVEGFMVDGEGYFPAVFLRNYPARMHDPRHNPFYPHIIEDGGVMPYVTDYAASILTTMEAAALALGVRDGIVKGDLVIHDNMVYVIEIALRMSGGFFGTVATPVTTGVDMLGALIDWTLEPLDTSVEGPCYYTKGTLAAMRLKHGASKQPSAIRFSIPGLHDNKYEMSKVVNDSACLFAYTWPGKVTSDKCRSHGDRAAVVVASGIDTMDASRNAERLRDLL